MNELKTRACALVMLFAVGLAPLPASGATDTTTPAPTAERHASSSGAVLAPFAGSWMMGSMMMFLFGPVGSLSIGVLALGHGLAGAGWLLF